MISPEKLREALQERDIIVLHITPEIMGAVVVYLHGPACQWYEARRIARSFPGVGTVTFADAARTLMMVSS